MDTARFSSSLSCKELASTTELEPVVVGRKVADEEKDPEVQRNHLSAKTRYIPAGIEMSRMPLILQVQDVDEADAKQNEEDKEVRRFAKLRIA